MDAVSEEDEAEEAGVGLQMQGTGTGGILRHEVRPSPKSRVRQNGEKQENEMEVLQGHGVGLAKKLRSGLLDGLKRLLKATVHKRIAVSHDKEDEQGEAEDGGEGEHLVDERALMVQVHEDEGDEV